MVVAAARHGDPPAELVQIAEGRVDVLESALALHRPPNEFEQVADARSSETRISQALALLREQKRPT